MSTANEAEMAIRPRSGRRASRTRPVTGSLRSISRATKPRPKNIITAEKGETVIGNGELLGKEAKADGKETWHYKMPVPHSTYLVSFIIGKYVRIEDKYNDIPLGYYVYPGRETTAQNAFGRHQGHDDGF